MLICFAGDPAVIVVAIAVKTLLTFFSKKKANSVNFYPPPLEKKEM